MVPLIMKDGGKIDSTEFVQCSRWLGVADRVVHMFARPEIVTLPRQQFCTRPASKFVSSAASLGKSLGLGDESATVTYLCCG